MRVAGVIKATIFTYKLGFLSDLRGTESEKKKNKRLKKKYPTGQFNVFGIMTHTTDVVRRITIRRFILL